MSKVKSRKHGNLDCLGYCGLTTILTSSHCSNYDIWWQGELKKCIYCQKKAKLMENEWECKECFKTEKWKQFRGVR